MKKNLASFTLVAIIALLAGCGATSNDEKVVPMQKNVTTQAKQEIEKNETKNLPPATGDIDDAVDAITSGADSEKEQAISDEADAKAAIDNSEEINNLNNAYDENNL